MAEPYSKYVDESDVPLETRIALARINEQPLPPESARSTLHGGPAVLATGRELAGDDADLNVVSPLIERRACLFIHPGKSFSMLWGFLTVVVVMWVVLSLPFKLAFLSERFVD